MGTGLVADSANLGARLTGKKVVQRRKHVPQRTCVGCQEVLPKRTMIRVVRTAEAVLIDPTGRMAGRGAYLHSQRSCWERGLKGALARALKTELTREDKQRILDFLTSLPEDATNQEEQADGG